MTVCYMFLHFIRGLMRLIYLCFISCLIHFKTRRNCIRRPMQSIIDSNFNKPKKMKIESGTRELNSLCLNSTCWERVYMLADHGLFHVSLPMDITLIFWAIKGPTNWPIQIMHYQKKKKNNCLLHEWNPNHLDGQILYIY